MRRFLSRPSITSVDNKTPYSYTRRKKKILFWILFWGGSFCKTSRPYSTTPWTHPSGGWGVGWRGGGVLLSAVSAAAQSATLQTFSRCTWLWKGRKSDLIHSGWGSRQSSAGERRVEGGKNGALTCPHEGVTPAAASSHLRQTLLVAAVVSGHQPEQSVTDIFIYVIYI